MSDAAKKYQSFGGYGVDVGIERADDLDKIVLEELLQKENQHVLDLGCGAGGQSVRMVQAGATVVGVDIHDFVEMFAAYRVSQGLAKERLSFMAGDIREVKQLVGKEAFTVVVLQRVLHYLRYDEALTLLKDLRELVTDSLYLSVTGVGSAVGAHCGCVERDIRERFCTLDEQGVAAFQIREPICLYKEAEFLQLLEVSGWQVERWWESAFGNYKAVCR